MAIRLRAVIKHPSRIEGGSGITVEKENGVTTVALDLASYAEAASIADDSLTFVPIVTPGLTADDPDVVELFAVEDLLALAVALDPELAAIAGLTSAANKFPYFTGAGAAALADLTAYARTLLDDSTAGAALTTLGVSAYAQTILDDATAGAALTTLGISAYAQTILDDANAGAVLTTLGISAFAQTILDDADASAVRTTIGAQASDAELTALAGLTSAADKAPYFTGSGTAALADFPAYGRSIAAVANEAAFKALVNLEAGVDYQAFHARLADISGITYAQGDVFYYDGANIVKLPKGTNGHFLKIGATIPEWAAVPGGGDLLAANNLSDVASAATAFSNIKQAASTTATGVVELATDAETQALADTARGVTPSNIASLVATQANMEAATALDRFGTPGRAHFHPGVAKVFGQWSSTGALGTISYGISSVTDTAVGDQTANTSVTFSNATACAPVVSCIYTASGGFVPVPSVSGGTTTFQVRTRLANDGGFIDAHPINLIVHGDL